MTPTQATATPDQLLPCPFCGGDAIAVIPDEVGSGGQHVSPYHAVCDITQKGCGVMLTEETEAEAIAAWNCRSSVPTPMSDTAAAQTCMGCMSPEACIARGQCDYGDKVPMSDSTVAAGGDEMAQVEQACQLSAAEWQAVAEQAERDRAGYASAFYRIAEVLGIPAQANTPEAVFEREMLPALRASLSATGVPPPAADCKWCSNTRRSEVDPSYPCPWCALSTPAPAVAAITETDLRDRNPLMLTPPQKEIQQRQFAAITERQESVHPAATSRTLPAAPQLDTPCAIEAERAPDAWMSINGERVVPASAKATADREGGASASAMKAYPVPLYAFPLKEPGKAVRMLTTMEIADAIRTDYGPSTMNRTEALQFKFCEVNALHLKEGE